MCGFVPHIGRGRGGEVEVEMRESDLLCNIRNVNQRVSNQRVSREKNVKDGRWDDGIEK